MDSLTDIEIAVTKLGFETAAETSPSAAYTDTTTTALGLVSSSNGLNFWAPAELSDDADDYTSMSQVTTKTGTGKWAGTNEHVGYLKYGIHVTSGQESGAGRHLKITLETPELSASHDHIQSAYRIAFGESAAGYATGSMTVYSDTAISHTGYTGATTKSAAATTTAIGSANVVLDLTSVKTSDEGGISKYYILSVWAEGTAATATNDMSGESIKVSAKFELA